MSQEKKPRKPVVKKGVIKKSFETPAEALTMKAAPQPVPASPKSKARVNAKAKTPPKSQHQFSIEDIIRLRAYEIYLQRGGTPGNPHEDWQVAEREVREHFGAESGQEADA